MIFTSSSTCLSTVKMMRLPRKTHMDTLHLTSRNTRSIKAVAVATIDDRNAAKVGVFILDLSPKVELKFDRYRSKVSHRFIPAQLGLILTHS